MKKTLAIFAIGFFFVLIGCNPDGTEENGSYAMIVVVNNKEYNGTEEKLDVLKQRSAEISKILKKTKAYEMPQENSQSNSFSVGSTIYSVKGTDDFIIVKDKKNKKWLLQKTRDIEKKLN
ncbi:hypothetical protein [Exiguobacterium acetylicum]|uniref:hypothetical protein n=1 Tax=Exiguobacterium acetylicum TaxID=41170 RepID=UPI001EE2E9BF|nr:hypothetical protein [Exiguobacterium acetylicum]UKS54754.1 hypothetical protein K6T22_09315 [Exiguobacterium acetylicum]